MSVIFHQWDSEKSIWKHAMIWAQLTFIVMRVGRTFFCGCFFLCMFSRWEVHVQLKHRGWPLVQTKQNTHTAAARDGQLSGQHGPWRGTRVKQTPALLWSVGNYSDWEQMSILKTERASVNERGGGGKAGRKCEHLSNEKSGIYLLSGGRGGSMGWFD